jgi:hypothetical protein
MPGGEQLRGGILLPETVSWIASIRSENVNQEQEQVCRDRRLGRRQGASAGLGGRDHHRAEGPRACPWLPAATARHARCALGAPMAGPWKSFLTTSRSSLRAPSPRCLRCRAPTYGEGSPPCTRCTKRISLRGYEAARLRLNSIAASHISAAAPGLATNGRCLE